METQQQYVMRKLQEDAINVAAVCRELKMSREKVRRIRNGGETSASSMQKLYDYLKRISD